MINVYDDILSNPSYFKALPVKDYLLVNYQCPQMEEWIDLYSHFNHIIYTLSGKKILNTPNKSYFLSEGSLTFVKKGAVRQGRFFDSEWVVIVFCFPDNYLSQSLKEYRSQVPLHITPLNNRDSVIELSTTKSLHSYFLSVIPYFTQQPSPPESLLELKCRELIFNILSDPANAEFLSYLNNLSDCNKPLLSEIMEANYTFNLSLEELAKISQRSLTSFKNEFVTTFHMSPGKWIVQKRLEHARMLLSVSQKNVNEIVYECGFESPTHFSRVFKQKFGMAPLQYRRQIENVE